MKARVGDDMRPAHQGFDRRAWFKAAGLASIAAAVAVPSVVSMPAAYAAPLPAPGFITCPQWGARAPRKAITMGAKPTHVAIHHTATANRGARTRSAEDSFVRSIQTSHMARNSDIRDTLQNFTVTQGARIYEGRHRSLEAVRSGRLSAIGGHIRGGDAANQKAVGIETEGTFSSALPSASQYRALVHLVAYICQQYRIPVANILGHRDFAGNSTTECCGNAFYPKLAILRKDVAATLNAGRVITSDLGGSPGSGGAYPTLRVGSRGAAVTKAQSALLKNGFNPGAVDGVFGAKTEVALKGFQAKVKLTADGVLGPKSWCALMSAGTRPIVKEGSSGEAVTRVQRALNARRGSGLQEDGKFGPATGQAARSYQSTLAMQIDGVVGAGTWGALQAGR